MVDDSNSGLSPDLCTQHDLHTEALFSIWVSSVTADKQAWTDKSQPPKCLYQFTDVVDWFNCHTYCWSTPSRCSSAYPDRQFHMVYKT